MAITWREPATNEERNPIRKGYENLLVGDLPGLAPGELAIWRKGRTGFEGRYPARPPFRDAYYHVPARSLKQAKQMVQDEFLGLLRSHHDKLGQMIQAVQATGQDQTGQEVGA